MSELPFLLAVALATGALAGLLAGLLGVGGGIVIVPVLAALFAAHGYPPDAVMQFALATSLASILFTGLSAVHAHQARGAVRWDLVRMLVLPLMLGALAGAQVADRLGSEWLMRLFGGFALVLGLQMLLARAAAADDRQQADGAPRVPVVRNLAGGGIIGFASAIFGIGGGSLTVPWLHATGVRMQSAVATSSACGIPIALAGATGYVVAGWTRVDLPAGSLGYVHVPVVAALALASVPLARVGAAWAHRLPALTLRRVFGLVLLGTGLDFLLR